MQEKIIKRMVVKQLKRDFPDWRRLPKAKKKALAKQVLEEAVAQYNEHEGTDMSLSELTGTAIPLDGIIALSEMGAFIEESTRSLLNFRCKRWKKHFDDPELRQIDELLDDRVLNRLLAPEGYTPSMRDIYPCHYIRAELLKALRYQGMSYRNYCKDVINRLDSKRQRTFIHLPLHKYKQIDHTQLSQFRRGLSVTQTVNLMVYMVHLLINSGKISHPFRICGVDSTELAAVCSPRPLATVTLPNKKKVRIYAELDADCGKRRKKRDKSEYVVGYRVHTLVAFDAKTGANYPIISMVAPANHHDKLFLPQLVALAHAMGVHMEVITADEGYLDPEQNEQINQEYGVRVITAASEKVSLPEHVDAKTRAVYMDGNCETPMRYLGRTEIGHEYGCNGQDCFYAPLCRKWREIPLDSGYFGQIPQQIAGVDKVVDVRKHMERCFNLAKHREGLEPLRVKSQHSTLVAATFSHMATLLLEMVETRKTPKKEERPKQLKMNL